MKMVRDMLLNIIIAVAVKEMMITIMIMMSMVLNKCIVCAYMYTCFIYYLTRRNKKFAACGPYNLTRVGLI
jgi:hypothetical protein